MDKSLAHTKWNCKYHLIWIPTYRRKIIYGRYRREIGRILRQLCEYKGIEILEAQACSDHIHMLVKIPPKYAVSSIMGYLKGKSAISIARTFLGRRGNMTGQNFWARGYYVSTAGKDEEAVREYIRQQEEADRRLDQMNLFE